MRQSYLVLVTVLATSPAVLAVALSFVVTGDPDAAWGPWPVVVAAIGVAGVLGAELLGYRVVPSLPPGTASDAASSRAHEHWRASAMLRFALCDTPFFLTVALAFSVPTPRPALLLGLSAAIAVAGILIHCWPWARPVGKVADRLERDGGRTRLREDLAVVTHG